MSALMFVRDGRTLPFVPVTIAAMEAIRAATPKRRPYAVATYLALLEFANEDRSDRVALAQREIVERVGASRSTVQAALADLQAAGVLRVLERIHGNARVENEYVVIEPDDRSAESCTPARDKGDPPPVTQAANPRSTAVEVSQPGSQISGDENGSNSPLIDATCSEPSREGARAKGGFTHRRRKVSAGLAESAERVLAAFNEATGSTYRARKRSGQETAELKQVAGAMLDRDDVSEAEWVAGVRAMAASPPDWIDGQWIVGHMFGEKSSAHTVARARPVAIAASGGGNVHRFASKFERAQAGLQVAYEDALRREREAAAT